MRGVTKYKLATILLKIPPTSKPYLPPYLGKLAEKIAVKTNTVGFFQACVEERGPYKLNKLPPCPHPAATPIEHMQVHGVPITAERGMP